MVHKLPPYGKRLNDIIANNIDVTQSIYIFIGLNAWEKAQAFQMSRPTTMCLPGWSCPLSYYWPVNECDVLIFDTTGAEEEYVEDLVMKLYEHGAEAVRFISHEFEMTIYKKEF